MLGRTYKGSGAFLRAARSGPDPRDATIATLTAALEEARGALELTVRSLRELQRSTGLLNDADKTELEAALAALATINEALGRVEG